VAEKSWRRQLREDERGAAGLRSDPIHSRPQMGGAHGNLRNTTGNNIGCRQDRQAEPRWFETLAFNGESRPRMLGRMRARSWHDASAAPSNAVMRQKMSSNCGTISSRLAAGPMRRALHQFGRGRGWRASDLMSPVATAIEAKHPKGSIIRVGLRLAREPGRYPCVSDRSRMAETRLCGSGAAKSAARRATPDRDLLYVRVGSAPGPQADRRQPSIARAPRRPRTHRP
jgi:hypothetical protein